MEAQAEAEAKVEDHAEGPAETESKDKGGAETESKDKGGAETESKDKGSAGVQGGMRARSMTVAARGRVAETALLAAEAEIRQKAERAAKRAAVHPLPLGPTPCTLHPVPCTLYPIPYTRGRPPPPRPHALTRLDSTRLAPTRLAPT